VSGQLSTAGMAFGDLVRLTGAAVADTQQKLNKTAADSTSALAKTLVDVIAVQEVDYDDNGTVTGSKTFTSQLPLIDVVDPVLYQWSQVRLQGRFTASQFGATSSTDTHTNSSTDSHGQAGVLLIFGGGYNNFQWDDSQTLRRLQLPDGVVGRPDADERDPTNRVTTSASRSRGRLSSVRRSASTRVRSPMWATPRRRARWRSSSRTSRRTARPSPARS